MLAQEGARLAVVVLDPSDAAVPSAKVTLIQRSRGSARSAETEVTGNCYFGSLNPGAYRLEVEKQGFDKYVIEDLELHARDFQTLRLNIKVAAAEKTEVTVKGTVEGVQIDTSTGTTVSGRYSIDLPSNARSIQSLVLMAPGIIYAGGNLVGGGDVNANGLRSNTNYYTVDGLSANAGAAPSTGGGLLGGFGTGGTTSSTMPATAAGNSYNLISLEAMQEFRVQTSTFAPEFGRSPGAQVSVTSRSGSNFFHGSAYGMYRNDRFNANDWFANSNGLSRGELRMEDYGGTVGGPIEQNKTFFFASFEDLHLTQPRTALDTVPDLASRKFAGPALQPYLNAFPIPNGQDLGNGAAQFLSVYSTPSSTAATSVRVDHVISDRTSGFLRYSYTPSDNTSRGGFDSS
ncbi:MAG: carboxypeptidase-like regulatory domain-containing protein, partial [Bryobacteraceae bacterium]